MARQSTTTRRETRRIASVAKAHAAEAPSRGRNLAGSRVAKPYRLAKSWGGVAPAWVSWLAWPLAALVAAAVVGLVQIRDRAPLVWDESYRVSQGVFISYSARAGRWEAVWDWINAQTFYPFVLPVLHGIIYSVTENVMISAWLPGLLGYTIAGLLAGRVAAALGAGRTGAWAAALLAWLIPLCARLASGGFTEPLGSALLLGVALLLVHLSRPTAPVVAPPTTELEADTPGDVPLSAWRRGFARIRRRALLLPVMLSLTIAGAWFLKYDYGLLAAGATGITVLVAMLSQRSLRVARPFLGAAVVLAIPVLAWLSLDTSKWRGLRMFVGQAVPSEDGNPDPFYYAQSLFGRGGVSDTVWLGTGLAPGIALLFAGSFVWAGWKAWRTAAFRGPVILVVLWYLVYSAANWQDPRYFATILPTIAALAGTALGYAVAWYRTNPHSRRVQIAASVVVALLAVQLVQQVVGSAGLTTQATFLRPNKPATRALAVAVNDLKDRQQPVVMIGHSNELSFHALSIAWSEELGSPSPAIRAVPEPGTAQAPGPADRDVLLSLLRRTGTSLVVGIDIQEGSRMYTEDFVERWPSQPKYIAFAKELEQEGIFKRVSNTELENGHLGVIVWELNRQLLGPKPTFTGTVKTGVSQVELMLDPPITYEWTAKVDRATGAFETTTPARLPAGSYTVTVNKGAPQPFTITDPSQSIPIRGTVETGKTKAKLVIEPGVTVRWTAPVDPATGAFESEVPARLPTGSYSLLIGGQPALNFVITS